MNASYTKYEIIIAVWWIELSNKPIKTLRGLAFFPDLNCVDRLSWFPKNCFDCSRFGLIFFWLFLQYLVQFHLWNSNLIRPLPNGISYQFHYLFILGMHVPYKPDEKLQNLFSRFNNRTPHRIFSITCDS